VALQRISFSPGASARFLERAVADLETKTTLEWPEAWRLARIVETAAGRRHDEAVAELDKLQRHRENNVRQFARQALERLRNPQHR